MSYISIIITFVFVNNLILSKFLGLCPFIGVSKNMESALGMGCAVTFVMTLASLVTYVIYYGVLERLGLQFLKTVVFILVIASLVQLVEMIIKRYSPSLYKSLGIYLPLITTNCGVMGIALLNIQAENYNPLKASVAGISAGIGFMLSLILMSGIRTQLQAERVPRFLKGSPIAFISGGLMALAFSAFNAAFLKGLLGG